MYNDWIEGDYRVFGIHKFNEEECACGNPNCTALGKHPRTANWQHTPDWSDEQIETMELAGHFDSGYGILVKGLLVVDVDARNGGVDSFTKLSQDIPEVLGAGCIVDTGSGEGSKHLFFAVPEDLSLVQSHNDYPGIDFKSSGFVIGEGSKHISGNLYELAVGSPFDIEDAPESLIKLLAKPEYHRASVSGEMVDVSHGDITAMLEYIDPDCDYEDWYRIGMAVHHATGGTGQDLWSDWSAKGAKFTGISSIELRWHSFGKSSNPVTLATLFHHAMAGGWQQSVEFVSDVDFGLVDDAASNEGLPFDISGVDLLRPPGFAGELCDWVNKQCRYPRQHLAVGATLTALGNVCGMRYTDDRDGVTANLFAFCVAGSGTGKEAIQQAIAEIHRAAGIGGATHGAIKSEQEIIRNLIRHQAALYIVDEIGFFLQKVNNARKGGGASYLEGVIGTLMSAYSKAHAFMLLTGDVKEDVKKMLVMELSQANKAVKENEDKEGAYKRRIPQLERALSEIDNGLERPFLSMIGFTTPVTFDGLVTYEAATNGFIGRSLLINERETNPRAARGFKKGKMSDLLKNTLSALYSGGSFNVMGARVEYYGEKVKVLTDPAAVEMLGKALDWIEEQSEFHKEHTGLEAVVRRGYEIMAKISLILAAPEGIRTAEHVRWAFALMKRDIEEKTRLAFANDNEKVNPHKALEARILNRIDKEHGETVNMIARKLRVKESEVLKVLKGMSGVHNKECENKFGKNTTKWYRL